MNIEELKADLCDTIDAAYLLAKNEGHIEIVQPFAIEIDSEGNAGYLPLGKRKYERLHAQ